MQTALYISIWAYLFTGPLSEPGQVFWLVKGLLARLPMWLFMPLVGCAKCHAGWVAIGYQQLHGGLDWHSVPFILIAISGAYALQTWHLIVDKWLHK